MPNCKDQHNNEGLHLILWLTEFSAGADLPQYSVDGHSHGVTCLQLEPLELSYVDPHLSLSEWLALCLPALTAGFLSEDDCVVHLLKSTQVIWRLEWREFFSVRLTIILPTSNDTSILSKWMLALKKDFT